MHEHILDRHIPRDFDAERGLLGGLLLDPAKLDSISLTADQFYDSRHRRIFAAIQECGETADAVTVCDRLERKGEIADIGRDYVGMLVIDSPMVSRIGRYAQIIRDYALERDLLAAVADIECEVSKPGDVTAKRDYAQSRIMSVAEAGTREPQSIVTHVEAYRRAIEARKAGGGGLRTHFADLDARIGGLKDGDLVVIAGRPSMGKTALAVQILENVCRNGGAGGLFSMEMATHQVLDRMVSGETRIPLPDIVSGRRLTDSNVQSALSHLATWKLVIDDSPGLTAMEIRTKARAMKRKHGIQLLVVDYLQLMSSSLDNRVQAVEEISRSLKALAKELSIPVIALSQLSRKCEERTDKRPILSDLRDSGAIEQDADVVMFVYREEQYSPNAPQWKGLAEILIRKNRQGATGDVHMTWLGKYTRFENFAGEWPSNVVPVRRRAFGDD